MKTKIFLLSAIFSISLLCYSQEQSHLIDTTFDFQPNIGDNLNLLALGQIIKECKNPQEIESKINQDNSVNNLDLDGDGNRDYLKVSENELNIEHEFTISDVQDDEEPQVATILVNSKEQTISLTGNPEYYGTTENEYLSSFPSDGFLLLSYILSPHRRYISPYHYGYYGYGYLPQPIVAYYDYHARPYIIHAQTINSYKSIKQTYTGDGEINDKSGIKSSTGRFSTKGSSPRNSTVGVMRSRYGLDHKIEIQSKNMSYSHSPSSSNQNTSSRGSTFRITPSRISSNQSSPSRSSSYQNSPSRSSSYQSSPSRSSSYRNSPSRSSSYQSSPSRSSSYQSSPPRKTSYQSSPSRRSTLQKTSYRNSSRYK